MAVKILHFQTTKSVYHIHELKYHFGSLLHVINRYYTSVEALDFVRNKSVYDIEHCT